MRDSSRSAADAEGHGDAQKESDAAPAGAPPNAGEAAKAPAPFIGNAMRALFEASDVSIKRGDETRVMSRAQEALAEIQRKTSAPPPPNQPASVPPPAAISSRPPAPRVDAVLWIVLAVGLFAIAGWMVAYAL